MTTDITPLTSPAGLPAATLWQQQTSRERLLALAGAVVVLLVAYAADFQELEQHWHSEPNYSHGYLVIPIALWIAWQRLSEAEPVTSTEAAPAAWWGWVFLVPVLVLRGVAYERNWQWVDTATILPVIFCLVWSYGSWPLFRRLWPALAFLVFMLPLPNLVNDFIVMPLQLLAATGSYYLLQFFGVWVIQDGNLLTLKTNRGSVPLNVAEACSGLRMLMTMAATITATIILIPLPNWKRVTLLFSVIPIALLSNLIRIVATGLCLRFMTGKRLHEWAHDMAGWLMMPLALALVLVELGVLAWLVPSEADDALGDDRKIMLKKLTDDKKKASPDELGLTPEKMKSRPDEPGPTHKKKNSSPDELA